MNYVACRFAFGDLTFEEARRSVELFAEQVMPRLQASATRRRRIIHERTIVLPIPVQFQGRLSIPAVAAPMFLVSNPDLVVEACRAGIIGTFPALNHRSSEDYEAWLVEIRERLDRIERDTGRAPARRSAST